MKAFGEEVYFFSLLVPIAAPPVVVSLVWQPAFITLSINGQLLHSSMGFESNESLSLFVMARVTPAPCNVTLPAYVEYTKVQWNCSVIGEQKCKHFLSFLLSFHTLKVCFFFSFVTASTMPPSTPPITFPSCGIANAVCNSTFVNITTSITVTPAQQLPITTQTVVNGNLTVISGGVISMQVSNLSTIAVPYIEILNGCTNLESGSVFDVNVTASIPAQQVTVLQQNQNCSWINFTTLNVFSEKTKNCLIGEQNYQNGKFSVLLSTKSSCGGTSNSQKKILIIAFVAVAIVVLLAIVGLALLYFGYVKRKFSCLDCFWRSGQRDSVRSVQMQSRM